MAKQTSFYFFHGPHRKLSPGVNRRVARRSVEEVPLPSLVLGRRPFDNHVVAPWVKLIKPASLTDAPVFTDDGRLVHGSIIDAPEGWDRRDRYALAAYRDPPGTVYVTVFTGILRKPGESRDNAAMRFMAENKTDKILPHGAFSFHRRDVGTAKLIESAQEEETGHGLFEAQMIEARAGSYSQVGGFLSSLFLEFRMPRDSVLIIGHPDGDATRLVNDRDAFKNVDASGYRSFFDELYAAHDEQRRARRAERAQQKKSA